MIKGMTTIAKNGKRAGVTKLQNVRALLCRLVSFIVTFQNNTAGVTLVDIGEDSFTIVLKWKRFHVMLSS